MISPKNLSVSDMFSYLTFPTAEYDKRLCEAFLVSQTWGENGTCQWLSKCMFWKYSDWGRVDC